MARQLMRELRRLRVAFIVAPYEADAQLSFLVREGFCAAAITEDSDLLVYQCPHVIYKLEPSGHGRLTSFENLRETEHNHALLFDGSWPGEWHEWVEELFLDMCILVGTDYMKGMRGIGLKTANALLRQHRSLEACLPAALARSGDALSPTQCAELSEALLDSINMVRDVYRHQLVYDPRSGEVVPLRPLPEDACDPGSASSSAARSDGEILHRTAHLGVRMNAVLARAVCIDATVDPQTYERVDDRSSERIAAPVPLPLPPAAMRSQHTSAPTGADGVQTDGAALSGSRSTAATSQPLHAPLHPQDHDQESVRSADDLTTARAAPSQTQAPTTSRFFAAAVPSSSRQPAALPPVPPLGDATPATTPTAIVPAAVLDARAATSSVISGLPTAGDGSSRDEAPCDDTSTFQRQTVACDAGKPSSYPRTSGNLESREQLWLSSSGQPQATASEMPSPDALQRDPLCATSRANAETSRRQGAKSLLEFDQDHLRGPFGAAEAIHPVEWVDLARVQPLNERFGEHHHGQRAAQFAGPSGSASDAHAGPAAAAARVRLRVPHLPQTTGSFLDRFKVPRRP